MLLDDAKANFLCLPAGSCEIHTGIIVFSGKDWFVRIDKWLHFFLQVNMRTLNKNADPYQKLGHKNC